MDEWISVKDRLPEYGSTVKVRSKSFSVATADFVRCKGNEPAFFFLKGVRHFKPIEWQPLDESPKEQTQRDFHALDR